MGGSGTSTLLLLIERLPDKQERCMLLATADDSQQIMLKARSHVDSCISMAGKEPMSVTVFGRTLMTSFFGTFSNIGWGLGAVAPQFAPME